MNRNLIAIFAILTLMGCTRTHTPTTKQTSSVTSVSYHKLEQPNTPSDIPGIEEVGSSRWGAKYTIFLSPEWRNPMVFEIVPDGNGNNLKVRIEASDYGSFAITAKTNPSRTIITYLGEDGARHRLCTMKGVKMFINLQETGQGLDGIACEFLKVFLRSDMTNIAAQ